jgi:hypothetical protein
VAVETNWDYLKQTVRRACSKTCLSHYERTL